MAIFEKRHPPIGSRPGTLMVPADAPPPRIRVMQYTPDTMTEHEIGDPDELDPILAAGGVCWVDVQGIGDERVLRRLAETFSIHPLALEDVVNAPQRPNTDTYEKHQLYISRMITALPGGGLDVEQVTIFFQDDYVLTFQERPGDVLDIVRERMRQGTGPMRRSRGDYLAYAIIDTIIDAYYPAVEGFSDALESLEDAVVARPNASLIASINRLRRELLVLRRGVAPQRDAVNRLVRGDSPFVSETVRLYLRDTYDHCVQLVDVIEAYRELGSGLMNTYLSAVSNRTNEVMKVLTIMASIFIPLTFLAGIYGMNFDAMPELHVRWFYPFLLLTMAALAVGMIVYFRRRGWIGGDGGEP